MESTTIFLVTQQDSADKWAFTEEANVLDAVRITYSTVDHVIERIGENQYNVKYSREDIVVTDVFIVQRVPLYSEPQHL